MPKRPARRPSFTPRQLPNVCYLGLTPKHLGLTSKHEAMKTIAVFNNKGGVGKSTLTFHLGHALAEMGSKVLMIDLDPQCNLTIFGIETEELHDIWKAEDDCIEDFELGLSKSRLLLCHPRSIHFLLKSTEDGVSDEPNLPPPVKLKSNLHLIPGRLSIHRYENKLSERWSGAYQSDNLSLRTIARIRELCNLYGKEGGYDYILIDTSPSLGVLNKTIISTVDGFFIPAQPDMFSLYGVRNIGSALKLWKREFETIFSLISENKRKEFPAKLVQFLGFTIYNAKKYTGGAPNNPFNLAEAHNNYVAKIPKVIKDFISVENRESLTDGEISTPIGGISVIHTHNTFPSVAQQLNCPMWEVPARSSDQAYREKRGMQPVNQGSFGKYHDTKKKYETFACDLLNRVNSI